MANFATGKKNTPPLCLVQPFQYNWWIINGFRVEKMCILTEWHLSMWLDCRWTKHDRNFYLPIIPRREMRSCRNPSKMKLSTVKRFRSESVAMGHNDVRFAPKERFVDEPFSWAYHSNCARMIQIYKGIFRGLRFCDVNLQVASPLSSKNY